jgi:hypothetical protein
MKKIKPYLFIITILFVLSINLMLGQHSIPVRNDNLILINTTERGARQIAFKQHL